MKIYNLNTIINFGMHEGKTISEILEFSGYEKFDFPELKNKVLPKRKVRKPGEKLKPASEEEIKIFLNGVTLNTNPNGIKYINWCIINIDNFFISKNTIFEIMEKHPNFYISEEAELHLKEKQKELKIK